jgi:MFS family permease
MTSNYYVLLLTRFCFGAGEAGAFPNIGICVSRCFPALERARATGTVLIFIQLGGAIAPLVIVPIQMHYGWRTSFYVMGLPASPGASRGIGGIGILQRRKRT